MHKAPLVRIGAANSLLGSLVLVLLTALTPGCAKNPGPAVFAPPSAQEAPRSITTLANDTLVLTRIKSEILSDDLTSGQGIDIKVRHGVVYLSGTVTDPYQGLMLANLIRGVEGVVRVETRLVPAHTGTTFVTPDGFVTGKIKMALLKDEELAGLPIAVETTASQVTLTGQVFSQAQKQKTDAIAKSLSGQRQVVNKLVVQN